MHECVAEVEKVARDQNCPFAFNIDQCNFKLCWSTCSDMPSLYPALYWGCCHANIGQEKKISSIPSKAATIPMILHQPQLGSVSPLEAAQN